MSALFPVPHSPRLVGPFTATSGQTDFAGNFGIQDDADLAVTLTRGGVETALALDTDYEVIGAGSPEGFTVRLFEPATAGDIIAGKGLAVIQRLTSVAQAGQVVATRLDAELDRSRIIDAELRRDVEAQDADIAAVATLAQALIQSGQLGGYDARGPLAGKSAYDSQPAGFTYLATDQDPVTLYIRNGAAGTWLGPYAVAYSPAAAPVMPLVTVSTRVALAAASTTIGLACLSEARRAGFFKWRAGDYTAAVALDPGQGIFVAATGDPTGATGAWERIRREKVVLPQYWGAAGDGVTNDTAAVQSALTYAAAAQEVLEINGAHLLQNRVAATVADLKGLAVRGVSPAQSRLLVANATGGLQINTATQNFLVSVTDLAIEPAMTGAGPLLEINGNPAGTSTKHNAIVRGCLFAPANQNTAYDCASYYVRILGAKRALFAQNMLDDGVNSTGRATAMLDISDCYKPEIYDNRMAARAVYGVKAIYTTATEALHVIHNSIVGADYGVYFTSTLGLQPECWITNNHINSCVANVWIDGLKFGLINGNLFYCMPIEDATYSQAGTVVTVTVPNAGALPLAVGRQVHISTVTGGTLPAGLYTVATVINSSSFTLTAGASATTSGSIAMDWAETDFSDVRLVNADGFEITTNIYKAPYRRYRRHVRLEDSNSVFGSPVVRNIKISDQNWNAYSVIAPIYIHDRTVQVETVLPAIVSNNDFAAYTADAFVAAHANVVSANAIHTRVAGRGRPLGVTADTTVSDPVRTYLNSKSGSTCVFTLPNPAAYTGDEITIVNKQAQLVNSASANVVPIGSGAAGTAILAATVGAAARLQSNGTYWYQVA